MANESFNDLFPRNEGNAERRNRAGSHARPSSPPSHGTRKSAPDTRSASGRIRSSARPSAQTTRAARAASAHAREGNPATSAPLEPISSSPYRDQSRYLRGTTKPPDPRKRTLAVIAAVVVLAAVAIGGFALYQSMPAAITLNGAHLNVGGDKTLADALRASGIKPKPGDLVAVDGSVLEEGGGEPLHAIINGQPTTDRSAKLNSGDVVELSNGNAVEEPADVVEESIPYTFEQVGNGPIHVLEGQGADGAKRTKTGSISGLTVEEVTQEPINATRRNVSPDVGGERVIALTFDDGPWAESTAQVLDVLAENDAKATFFTVGNRIEGEGANLVKRAAAEGHQICTHSFDHAAGDGQSVNLSYMSAEQQVAEIEQGYAAIESALGTEASRVFRAPGGNYDDNVMRNAQPLVSAEIGWNIDSRDWEKPGVDDVVWEIQNAWPGSIVLLHDGGGDRSQTVEALKRALPYLKGQGYRFVTIDELMEYPLV